VNAGGKCVNVRGKGGKKDIGRRKVKRKKWKREKWKGGKVTIDDF